MAIRRYFGVAALRWELPFSLRLSSDAMPCWEPSEGCALLRVQPNVGTIQWRRSNELLKGADVFGDRFEEEPDFALAARSYRIAGVIGEKKCVTTELLPGRDGGFNEAV